MIALVVPSLEYLPEYKMALEKDWSPDNARGLAAAKEELEKIAENPGKFVAGLTDPEARGDPIALPDGSLVPRLPGFRRWIWDGEFCGSVNFRWQPGTAALPPHCLGHMGYAVVPWKRKRGYATEALKMLLPEARKLGLPYVELTADPDNVPSQKVILTNGGVLIETFRKAEAYGKQESLRFRVYL